MTNHSTLRGAELFFMTCVLGSCRGLFRVTSSRSEAARRGRLRAQKLTFHVAPHDQKHLHCASSSSKALACFKSNVPKPSVNPP